MRQEILDLSQRLVETPSVTGNKVAILQALNLARDYLGEEAGVRDFKSNDVVSRRWVDIGSLATLDEAVYTYQKLMAS